MQVQLRIDSLVGRIPAYQDPERAPGGCVRPSALYVTAVLCDEYGVHGVASRTQYSEAEEEGCSWDYLLTFAPKYRDLLPTAQIALTVWEVREGAEKGAAPLGGTTLRLFSKKGRLKAGNQRLKLWLGREGDSGFPSRTPGKVPVAERGRAGHVERALKKYQRGEFESVPWLDALAVKAAQEMLTADAEEMRRNSGVEEVLQFIVDVPSFPLPVLYQDSFLPGSTAAAGVPSSSSSSSSSAVAASTEEALSTPITSTAAQAQATTTTTTTAQQQNIHYLSKCLANGTGGIILMHDPEVGRENPSEIKAQKLARSTGRGLVDAGLRPNTEERSRIEAVIAQPPGRPLPREDRELLWRFRFALVGEGRALTRFLKCVDWGDAAEAAQAADLMSKWARISVADALELLSPDYPVEAVRAHAVAALKSTSEEELLYFLLQLVQALRYEPSVDSRLASFLIDRARRSAAVASALYWYLCAELEDPTFGERAAKIQEMLLATNKLRNHNNVGAGGFANTAGGSSSSSSSSNSPSVVPQDCIPLQVQLVARLRHLSLDIVRAGRSAERKTDLLRELLSPGGACADLAHFECPCPLDPGVKLLGIVASGCSVFKSKVSPMRITFNVALPPASASWTGGEGDSHPVAPTSSFDEISTSTTSPSGETGARLASLHLGHEEEEIMKERNEDGDSTAAPATSSPSLSAQQQGETSPPQSPPATASTSTTPPPPTTTTTTTTTTLSLIYKRGDDLRQDQLVLQMISLMDRLLKRENFDLRITAYQVLPTSANDGLIEFVPFSLPLSQVLREHQSIHRFLSMRHPDPKGLYGLDPGVLENYVRSCAGSVVLTHVLGIGDRHMDNLMLTTDGRLFHIDFGYVLGRDPKFSTAPLVLNRAMVEGMGGADGPKYKEFVKLCGEAYNILRKSSNLLLSLVHLMAESSIPDIRSDPEKALLKVQERLQLELDDEMAAAAMEEMIVAAQAAVLPRFAEVQHRVAQGWR